MGIDRLKNAYEEACNAFPQERKFKSFSHMLKRCREFLHGISLDDMHVIEIGAGSGFFSHYLVECGDVKIVEAVDDYQGKGSPIASGEIITRMQEILNNKGQLKILKIDFMKYVPDVPADCIIFINVLHHIVNHIIKSESISKESAVEKVLKHAGKCLKKNGIIIFQEFSDRNFYFFPFFRDFVKRVDYSSKISLSIWKATLIKAGFTNVEVRYRLPLILPEWKILRLLFNNRLASLLTDSSFIIKAERLG